MMGLCSARKFSRAVCKAVSRVVADLTAASAAFLVDTSVVAKIHACPAAIAARRNVAITSHTVALAKRVSEEAGLQNLHHGDGRGWADAFSWGALLDAGKGFGGSDCGSVMRLLARPGGRLRFMRLSSRGEWWICRHRSSGPVRAASRPPRGVWWPLSVVPIGPTAALGPWRGFCRLPSGCGLSRVPRPPSRLIPPASSARYWWAVSAHGSASERNCASIVHDLLDDGEQVGGAPVGRWA